MKDIPGYEGEYAITIYGEVWSYNSNMFLKKYMSGAYYAVSLPRRGKRVNRIHKLMQKTFFEPKEGEKYINHIDGNKLNNNLPSLRSSRNRISLSYINCR